MNIPDYINNTFYVEPTDNGAILHPTGHAHDAVARFAIRFSDLNREAKVTLKYNGTDIKITHDLDEAKLRETLQTITAAKNGVYETSPEGNRHFLEIERRDTAHVDKNPAYFKGVSVARNPRSEEILNWENEFYFTANSQDSAERWLMHVIATGNDKTYDGDAAELPSYREKAKQLGLIDAQGKMSDEIRTVLEQKIIECSGPEARTYQKIKDKYSDYADRLGEIGGGWVIGEKK